MPRFDRHFTLDQAQAMIPWVREVFGRIRQAIAGAASMNPAAPKSPSARPANGHGLKPNGKDAAAEAQIDRAIAGLGSDGKRTLVRALLRAIVDEGIVIQDIGRGLIDFPAWKHGHEVLLCYELSDGERIGFWHEVDDGFAGRQPLEGED